MSIRNVKYRSKVHHEAYNDPYTKVLLHFDESVTKDECGNTWTIPVNSPSLSNNGKFGKCLAINNNVTNSNYRLEGPNLTFDISKAPLCIDFWTKPYSTSNAYFGAWWFYTNVSNVSFGLRTGTALNFFYWNSSGGGGAYAGVEQTFYNASVGTWYHVALVVTSTYIKAYVNGVLQTTKNYSSDVTTLTFRYLMTPYNDLDEVRFSYGIERWTENFTPPDKPYVATIPAYDSIDVSNIKFYDKPAIRPNIALNGPGGSHTYAGLVPKNLKKLVQKTKVLPIGGIDQYTKVMLHFDTDAVTDECGNTWTAYGSPTIDTTNAKFGKALQLTGDGANKYLECKSLSLGGKDFTIDAWIYVNSSSDSYGRAFVLCNSSGRPGSSNTLRLSFQKTFFECESSTFGSASVGVLHHIAAVYQHSKGLVSGYIDGVLAGTRSVTYSAGQLDCIWLGHSEHISGSNNWAGAIDEFRVSDGIARWTENFTPPTEPYAVPVEVEDESNYTTPIALLHFDNPDKPVQDEVITNNWKMVGTPAIVEWLSKFNTCLKLNKRQQVYNELLSLSNSDFTVDFWARFMDGIGYIQIHSYEYVYNSDYPSEHVSNDFYWNVSNGVFKFGAGLDSVAFTGAHSIHDMMNHYAIVYKKSSNAYYCYFNGQLTGTLQTSSFMVSSGEPIQTYTIPVTHGISNVEISVIDGTTYIDEFRITPGIVWNNEFTPPTKPMSPETEPIPNPIASDILVHTENDGVLAIATKKKTPTLVLSATELTLAEQWDEETVTFNTDSDGDFDVWTNNTDLLSITRDANSFTVKNIGGNGAALVFVQVLEGREFEASEAVSINVGAYSWGPLKTHTPEEIQMAARLGIAPSIWNVGDYTSWIPITKFKVGAHFKLTYNTDRGGYSYQPFSRYIAGGEYRAFVLGFNHNFELEGNNTIHFMLENRIAFVDYFYGQTISESDLSQASTDTTADWLHHRDSKTNKGGWEKSVIRNKLFPNLFDHIPNEWRNAIHNSQWNYKYTVSAIGDVVDINGTRGDFFFLLSEYEVFGQITHSHPDEARKQEQYAYFRDWQRPTTGVSSIAGPTYRFKSTATEYSKESADRVAWWLRSPKYSNNTQYCRVNKEGEPGYAGSRVSLGIVPCFVIC